MRKNWNAHLHLAILCALLASCGGGGNAGPLTPARVSPQVLFAPPETTVHGDWQTEQSNTSWAWVGDESTPFLVFEWVDDDTGFAPICVDLPGDGCLWGDEWYINGEWWLVFNVIDANDVSTLYRMKDENLDGVPDPSTIEQVLTSSPNAAYWTQVTPPSVSQGTEGAIFILDARTQDVLVANDDDGDGWPDTLGAEPFAAAGDHPDLVEVASLIALPRSDELAVLATTEELTHDVYTFDDIAGNVYADSNGDGVADGVESNELDSIYPVLHGDPYSGQVTLPVFGGYNGAGKPVQIWEVDPAGNPTALLGTAVIGPDNAADVALARPLLEGETVRLNFDLPEEDAALLRTVRGTEPQSLGIAPGRVEAVDVTVPLVMTVTGLNFTPDMVVRMLDTEGNVSEPAFTFVDSTEITVVLPVQPLPTEPTLVSLWAYPPGFDEEDGAPTVTMAVTGPE